MALPPGEVGEVVITKLNKEVLTNIAKETNGEYI